MIHAMISGKLWACPEAKVGQQSGKPYVMAKVTTGEPTSDGGHFITLFAYNGQMQAVLMALGKGEAITVTGPLRLGTWTDSQGQTRVQASLVVETCTTLHDRRRVDRAVQQARHGQGADRDAQQRPREGAPARSLRETRTQWDRSVVNASGFDDMDSDMP